MSKQGTKDEAEVPIPSSFEINNDEKWAANHTEFRADFVSNTTSDGSDDEMLNIVYPSDDSDEDPVVDDGLVLDRPPLADVDLGLPPNDDQQPGADDEVEQPAAVDEEPVASDGPGLPPDVDEEVPAVNSDGVMLPAPNSEREEEEDDDMLSKVGELSSELVLGMAEKTLASTGSRIIAATKTFSAKLEDVNNDATALIFPTPQDDSKTVEQNGSSTKHSSRANEPSTKHSSGASVCHSVETTDTNWSKRVMKKIKNRKKVKEEPLPVCMSETEDTREPEESRAPEENNDDDSLVWQIMNMCGGLKEYFDIDNGQIREQIRDSAFDDCSELTDDMKREKYRKSKPVVPVEMTLKEEKKSFKDKIKGGKMKLLLRRRRSSKQQSELLKV